ncbi:hypothetical protein HDU97_002982 [Phlyctochytrium planicorne]|nr:hypothetical protein HDU97_002982 [Phlyctochytrium planicorne]
MNNNKTNMSNITSNTSATTTSDMEAAQQARNKAKSRQIRRAIIFMITVNIILPLVIYSVLVNRLGQTMALILSGIPPLLDALLSLIRRRKFEPIASTVVVSIVLAIIVSVLTQDNRTLLAKESLTTICLGIGFLVSVGFSYNLIWQYNRQFAGDDAEAQAELEEQYKIPAVKSFTNKLCVLWGVGLIVEAIIRVALIYIVDINIMVYVSPAILVLFMVILITTTLQMIKKAKAQQAAMMTSQTQLSNNPRGPPVEDRPSSTTLSDRRRRWAEGPEAANSIGGDGDSEQESMFGSAGADQGWRDFLGSLTGQQNPESSFGGILGLEGEDGSGRPSEGNRQPGGLSRAAESLTSFHLPSAQFVPASTLLIRRLMETSTPLESYMTESVSSASLFDLSHVPRTFHDPETTTFPRTRPSRTVSIPAPPPDSFDVSRLFDEDMSVEAMRGQIIHEAMRLLATIESDPNGHRWPAIRRYLARYEQRANGGAEGGPPDLGADQVDPLARLRREAMVNLVDGSLVRLERGDLASLSAVSNPTAAGRRHWDVLLYRHALQEGGAGPRQPQRGNSDSNGNDSNATSTPEPQEPPRPHSNRVFGNPMRSFGEESLESSSDSSSSETTSVVPLTSTSLDMNTPQEHQNGEQRTSSPSLSNQSLPDDDQRLDSSQLPGAVQDPGASRSPRSRLPRLTPRGGGSRGFGMARSDFLRRAIAENIVGSNIPHPTDLVTQPAASGTATLDAWSSMTLDANGDPFPTSPNIQPQATAQPRRMRAPRPTNEITDSQPNTRVPDYLRNLIGWFRERLSILEARNERQARRRIQSPVRNILGLVREVLDNVTAAMNENEEAVSIQNLLSPLLEALNLGHNQTGVAWDQMDLNSRLMLLTDRLTRMMGAELAVTEGSRVPGQVQGSQQENGATTGHADTTPTMPRARIPADIRNDRRRRLSEEGAGIDSQHQRQRRQIDTSILSSEVDGDRPSFSGVNTGHILPVVQDPAEAVLRPHSVLLSADRRELPESSTEGGRTDSMPTGFTSDLHSFVSLENGGANNAGTASTNNNNSNTAGASNSGTSAATMMRQQHLFLLGQLQHMLGQGAYRQFQRRTRGRNTSLVPGTNGSHAGSSLHRRQGLGSSLNSSIGSNHAAEHRQPAHQQQQQQQQQRPHPTDLPSLTKPDTRHGSAGTGEVSSACSLAKLLDSNGDPVDRSSGCDSDSIMRVLCYHYERPFSDGGTGGSGGGSGGGGYPFTPVAVSGIGMMGNGVGMSGNHIIGVSWPSPSSVSGISTERRGESDAGTGWGRPPQVAPTVEVTSNGLRWLGRTRRNSSFVDR